jgi:hypothetical protein
VPTVYLETTIPSYLTARPSRDLIVAANQQLTRLWWKARRQRYQLFVSQVVLDEAAVGDKGAALRRLRLLRGTRRLTVTDACRDLAQGLLDGTPIPAAAAADALHVAIAAVHRMDFLLTWNCTHIANAVMRPGIQAVCAAAGYNPPVICTPQELMEV